MKKTLFAVAALVAGMSANAQPEGITAHAPVVPWGAQAEIVVTNDLTTNATGKWYLTEDAQKWVVYERDGVFASDNEVQQTNRNSVWFNIYAENDFTLDGKTYGCDEMIVAADHNWGGQTAVTSKAGSNTGLIVVGKTRHPHFYVTGTDKAKFYFYGSAGTAGYARIEVFEVGNTEPVMVLQGTKAQTKKTWDTGEVLIAEGLDKAKTYEFVAYTMALNAETNEYTYEGGDMVLQVVKLYGDVAPMREDGLIISGSEIGSYINAHLAAYPDVTDFTLEGSGKYTIKEGITATGKFTLTGVANAPATIDASALAAPFVQYAEIAEEAEKDENGFVAGTAVKFANIKVTGLAQALFSSNKQNYLIPELTIDNSVLALTGNPFVIDFRNGGLVAKVSVNKSTIWAAEATSNSFYTGQSGKKATEGGLEEQIFSFTNSTLSNICFGKNFFTHRQAGQTWLTFEVKNNIITNCGKDNFLASLNGGQASANPKYTVEGNTFLKTGTEGEGDEAVAALTNINDLQSTSDETEEIANPIAGVPFTLANATAGAFTVAASSQQAKYMTGDPRWLVPYATDAIKIECDLSENTDFVAVLNEALAVSEAPSSIEISFWEAGEYPTTGEINTTSPIRFINGSDINAGEATIVFNHGLTLGGQTEFNGVNIKAGDELAAPIIKLQSNPYKIQANGYSNFGSIKLNNLTVSNLKTHLIQGEKGIQISEIETKNSQIYMAGTISGSGNPPAIYDFRAGGVPVTWNFVNSTLDAANNAIFSTAGGEKAGNVEGVTMQTLNISNSTVINPVKKAFQHRQNNQKWLRYILKNSIIVVNADKPNFVAEMNAGGTGANPTWQVDKNSFMQATEEGMIDASDKQSTGDEAEPVTNSLTGVTTFADAANHDYTIEANSQQAKEKVGDPRWLVDFVNPFAEVYGIVGDLTGGWDADLEMTSTAWGIYEATVEGFNANRVKDYEYKLRTDKNWEGYQLPADDSNFKWTPEETGTYKLSFTLNVKENTLELVAERTGDAVDTYTLAGNETAIFGSAWDPTNANNDLILGENGIWTKTYENIDLSVGTKIEYKVVKNYDWNGSDNWGFDFGGGNADYTVPEGSGKWNITFYFVPEGALAQNGKSVHCEMVDVATVGINAIAADNMKNATYYNLQGVRVAQPTKGLYIVNGKKVVIK